MLLPKAESCEPNATRNSAATQPDSGISNAEAYWEDVRSVTTFWLSFHAPYACRHSGVCCSSGWDIAIERARVPAIVRAAGEGHLAVPARWLREVEDAPADVAGVLAFGVEGRCVFHRAPGCAVHTTIGHAAIPAACQHFPRIALIDRRGVFVTLSHYCPTAASLLFDDSVPPAIVEGPPVLPGSELPEGLDAREAWPPSQSPRRLMDLDSYSTWETWAVSVLTSGESPERALDRLENCPQITSPWDHGNATDPVSLFEIARASVPPPYSWPAFVATSRNGWAKQEAVVGRYLAAHVFAAWMAYQGNGLQSTVLYLRLVLAVLDCETARAATLFEGIRQADLLLRHFVDREALAARLCMLVSR